MWETETPEVLGKPVEPSEFDNAFNKIGSVEEQINQTARILDEIVSRLEGPRPTEASAGKNETAAPSLFGKLAERLADTDQAAANTLRIAQHLSQVIR